MAEARHELGNTQFFQRSVEDDLARRRREQVFTTQDVRDFHERVINGVDQRVQRVTIGADNDVVRNRTGLEGDLAADQVGEGNVLIGHAQAQNRLASLGAVGGNLIFGQITIKAVVTKLGILTLCDVASFDLFGSRVGLVGIAGFEELCGNIAVDVHALALAVRRVRAPLTDTFIPIQAQPTQRIKNLIERFLGIASSIGVFNTEDEGASGVARVCPVEEAGADHSHVRSSSWRRAESDANIGATCGSHTHNPLV